MQVKLRDLHDPSDLGSTSLMRAVMMRVNMMAALPRRGRIQRTTRPFCPEPIRAGSVSRVVGQTNATLVDELGEAVPALQHLINRLENVGRARELVALLTQPDFQLEEQRQASAHKQSLLSTQGVDLTLDVEGRVDTFVHCPMALPICS